MPNRRRGHFTSERISPPELPEDGPNQWVPGRTLEPGESYTDLIISDQDFDGQAASRVTLLRARATGTRAVGANFRFSRLTDVRLDRCDLANTDLDGSAMRRVEIHDCRMTGIKLNDAEIRDVVLQDCKLDLAQFRLSKFTDSRFCNCNLREADFYQADLAGVVFSGCDLRGVHLFGANLKGTDFRFATGGSPASG